MPEKVPLWVLENTFKTFGARMPKRAETLGDDLKVCANCQREMYKLADWNYCSELYYCNDCIGPARKAQEEKWAAEAAERRADWEREAEARRNSYGHGGYLRGFTPTSVLTAQPTVPMTEAQVPTGNLDEAMYQFWIGEDDSRVYKNIMTTRSTCRACGAVVFGAMSRALHKKASAAFYKDGYSCAKVITMAIRSLASEYHCFVCNARTNRKHYGVPICSPNCHKIWRFSEAHNYPKLELAIAPYWMTTTKTGGSSTSESSLSQTQTVSRETETE